MSVIRPSLASLLAHTGNAHDLLPHLHQHALDVTGGSCSLLFQVNPRDGILQATSGFALDTLRTEPWLPGAEEAGCVGAAFDRGAPTLIADATRQTPDLAGRLGAATALLYRWCVAANGWDCSPSASPRRPPHRTSAKPLKRATPSSPRSS